AHRTHRPGSRRHGAEPAPATGLVAALQDWLGAHLSEGLGAAVGRWLPGQAIADDIAVDPYDGLTGYTAGNGLATRRRFDLAGRLTTLDIQAVGRFDYGYRACSQVRSGILLSTPITMPFQTI
ncbi:MAG: hypothetical protein HGA75_17955, partial [Thiobacillus sp.]|nr:hypothetical protein [Thiobacillus sp.]